MIHAIRQLDQILRGETTRQSKIDHGQLEMPVGGLTVLIFVLGAVSGLCSGSFSVFRALWSSTGTTSDAAMQMLASAVKLPLLFLLTLLVTLPSLYVFSALAGSRLSLTSVFRLLLAMLGVMLTVLASLGPIIVFFGASTESYAFMKLLNVAAATVAGSLGLAFLIRTLQRLVSAQGRPSGDQAHDAAPSSVDAPNTSAPAEDVSAPTRRPTRDEPGPLERTGPTPPKARAVFRVWVIVFAVVGAQMSWVLRPFIGSPELPFSWFRSRQSNFFVDVARSFADLFGG